MTMANELQRRLGYAAPTKVLAAALHELFPGRIAVVSSSARVGRAAASYRRDRPGHARALHRHRPPLPRDAALSRPAVGASRLSDVPERWTDRRRDRSARWRCTRAIWDPDGCCAFRKTQPLQRALAGFDAWITGRKRFQAATRLDLPVFEADPPHIKINPLARLERGRSGHHVASTGCRRIPLSPKASPRSAARPVRPRCAPARKRAPAAARLREDECGIHQQRPTGK